MFSPENKVLFCNITEHTKELEKNNFFLASTIFPWFISRLRVFLYFSNPYEESFEFLEQVTDYHTEVPLHITYIFFCALFPITNP